MSKSKSRFRKATRTPAQAAGDDGPPVMRFLNQAVDGALAGIIFVAPLVLGGRHPVGRFVFVVLVALLAVAWFLSRALATNGRWRWSGAEWLIVAGSVLILAQLSPLSPAILAKLSPQLPELLPLWTGESAGFGTWTSISLVPSDTAGGLAMFVAYGLLFLIVVQRIQRLGDIERLLRWIALAATGMAALGIAQRFAGNGNFFWIYEDPFRNTNDAVKGAFINENHFAHFLALGVAPLLWWLQSGNARRDASETSSTRMLVGLALALVAVAGLLTFSRGGVVVIFLAAAVCVSIYARAGLLARSALVGLTAVGLFVGTALMLHGYAPLSKELASLGTGSVEEVDRYGVRRQLWAANLTAASQFPILGTGVGSHAEIYPAYFNNRFEFEYTHTENGYLQVLLETGVAGLIILFAGIATCCRWCFAALHRASSSKHVAAGAVVVVTLTISLVHSMWDFVWYLPACMSVTIVLLACGCRLYQMAVAGAKEGRRESPGIELSRLHWAAGVAAIVVLSAVMIRNRLAPALASPHWDRYLRQSVALGEQEQPGAIDNSLDAMIDSLQRTIDHNPHDARAQTRIANLLIRKFQRHQLSSVNSVSLQNLRQAALASRFASRQAQDAWLRVAVGDSRALIYKALDHARRGLKLCPLLGESYCDLAELAFLEGRGATATKTHLAQALQVRPYSADVLFAVGAQSAQAGDVSSAMQSWKTPFNQAPAHRQQIISLLASAVPPKAFMEHFQPHADALGDLFAYYHQLGRLEEAGEVGSQYVELLEESAASMPRDQAARQWLAAYEVHRFLGAGDAAVRCVANAVQADPDAYQPRLKLALQLLEGERYGDAIQELSWCQRRKPHDQVVLNCLRRARVGRLRQANSTDNHLQRTQTRTNR